MKAAYIFLTLLIVGLAVWTNARPHALLTATDLKEKRGDEIEEYATEDGERNDKESMEKEVEKEEMVKEKGNEKEESKKKEGMEKELGGDASNMEIVIKDCGGDGGCDECNSPDGSSVKGGDQTITFYPYQAPVYPEWVRE